MVCLGFGHGDCFLGFCLIGIGLLLWGLGLVVAIICMCFGAL